MTKKKIWKRKKLFKVFVVCPAGVLQGPYTGVSYWKGAEKLTVYNAKGWVSHQVPHPEMCHTGWHAYSRRAAAESAWGWDHTKRAIFQVELYNCFTDGYKWVGDQMRIVRRYSRENHREWMRRQKRARQA